MITLGGHQNINKLDALTKYGANSLLYSNLPVPKSNTIFPSQWIRAFNADFEDNLTDSEEEQDDDENDAPIFTPLLTTTSASESLNLLQDLARIHAGASPAKGHGAGPGRDEGGPGRDEGGASPAEDPLILTFQTAYGAARGYLSSRSYRKWISHAERAIPPTEEKYILSPYPSVDGWDAWLREEEKKDIPADFLQENLTEKEIAALLSFDNVARPRSSLEKLARSRSSLEKLGSRRKKKEAHGGPGRDEGGPGRDEGGAGGSGSSSSSSGAAVGTGGASSGAPRGRRGVVLLELVNSELTEGLRPIFLRELRTRCDEYGFLLVIDETMTGLRFGHRFLFEKYDFIPDFIVFGKAYGISGIMQTRKYPAGNREARYDYLSGFVTSQGDSCVFEASVNVMKTIFPELPRIRALGREIYHYIQNQLDGPYKLELKGAGMAFALPHSAQSRVFESIHTRYRYDRFLLPLDLFKVTNENLKRFLKVDKDFKPRQVASVPRRVSLQPVKSIFLQMPW